MEEAAANAGPTPGDPNKPLQQLEQEIKPRIKDSDLPEFSELRPSGLESPVEPVEAVSSQGPPDNSRPYTTSLPGDSWSVDDAFSDWEGLPP